jgi:hypothetical protein
MTISGSGVGGSIGGAQEPSILEREQTAANETLKTGMGLAITKDTLDLAFYELGGQIGRYPANANRPLLPPLISTRSSSGEGEKETSWKEALSKLINDLPEAVKNDYLAQTALPLDQRNLNFVAFDNVLSMTAMAMTWVANLSGPSATAGIEEENKAANVAMPFTAMEGMIDSAGSTVSKATEFLDSVGANYPQQDGLRNYTRLAGNNLEKMSALMDEVKTSQTIPTDKFAELSEKLSLISQQYSHVHVSDDLSMLGINLSAMASLSAAMALSDTCSPLFFMAMVASTVGLEQQSSATGPIGPALSASINALSSGLSEGLLLKSNDAVQDLLHSIITASLISAVTISSLIKEEALGHIPSNDPSDVESTKSFTTELALTLLVRSGVVGSTLSALVETFGLEPAKRKYLEQTLNLLALGTLFLTAAPKNHPENAASLAESMSDVISTPLNALSEWINEGFINQSFDTSAAQSTSIALNQAKIALDAGNGAEFMSSLVSLAALASGSSEDLFLEDFNRLQTYSQDASQTLSNGMNDLTNTDTAINIVA